MCGEYESAAREPDSNTAYPLKGATRVEVTAPDGTITLQATTHRTGSEGEHGGG